MAQVCGTCDRSWDDRAAFCGACGAHLAAPPLTHPEGSTLETNGGARGRWRWVVLGSVLAVGATLAVPAIDFDGAPPVAGDVDVPDRDGLQSAVAADTVQPPAGTDTSGTRATPVPPPHVSCFRGNSRIEFPCVLWIRRVHGATTTGQEMTMVGGNRVVAIGPGSLRGHDAATGRQVWEQPLDRPVDTAQVGDEVGVLHYGGRAEVFALAGGRWLWGVDAFRPLYGRTVANDHVLTSDRDEYGPKLVVYGARDGTRRWQARTDGDTIFSVVTSSARGALVLTHGNQLVFLDRVTGGPTWRLPPGAEVLAVTAAGVLVGSRTEESADMRLQSIAMATGDVLWQRTVGGDDVTVQGDRLLAATPTHLVAIDVASGEVAWRHDAGLPSALASGPGVHGVDGDSPVVLTWSADGALRGHDRQSGARVWRHEPPDGRGTVMYRDGLVLVHTADGMEALDVTTGEQLLRVHAGGRLQPVGRDPELAMDHRSGYAVGFDFPERRALLEGT